MKKSLFLLTLLVWAVLVPLSARNKDTSDDAIKSIDLDIDTAVALAHKNNLGLESEKLKQDQKIWAMATSFNTFIPTTNLSMGFTRFNERKTISPLIGYDHPMNAGTTMTIPGVGTIYDGVLQMAETELPEWNAALQLDMTFTFNAAMAFGVYQTILDYRSGKLSLDTAKKKLTMNVKKNFDSILLMQKNIKIMEENLATTEKRFVQAQINYRNGLIAEYQMLSAQVALENLKPSLMEIQNSYEIQINSFKQLIGIKNGVKISFNGNLDIEPKEFNAEELIKKQVEKRMDIKSYKLNISSLNNARNMSISALTPTFVLRYTMDPTFQQDLSKPDDWNTNDPLSDWKQMNGMLTLSFSQSLDALFPFSKKQMDIVKTSYSIRQMQVGLEQARLGAELEIRSLVMKLQKSIKSINSLKLNLALAEKAYKMAEEAYRAGSKDLLEVEDAQVKLNTAKFNLTREEYNYTLALLDLEYALEVGSSGGSGSAGSTSAGADMSGSQGY